MDSRRILKGDYYEKIPYSDYLRRQEAPEACYDIRDYGAEPGTLSTEAIQKALDDAGKEGGTVLVSGGVYLSGTVSVPSGVTLFISEDAVIKAFPDPSLFRSAFITVRDAEDVTITGGGVIDGQGELFCYPPRKEPLLKPLGYTRLQVPPIDPMGYPEGTTRFHYRERIRYAEDKYNEGKPNLPRPLYMLWVRGSRNVRLSNLVLRDSFSWTVSLDCSEDITAEDIVIDNNRHVANTDGIDIMGSERVRIRNCFISTADDGLCIKAPLREGHDSIEMEDLPMKGASDIEISGCTVMTVMNAFKIGTETYHDIARVHVHDCLFLLPDIFPGSVSGISIESADGSRVSDITVEDIRMHRVQCPLFICLNRRNKFGCGKTGSVERITIRNIKAEEAEVPSIVTGLPGLPLRNIMIDSLDVRYVDNEAELNVVRYENYDEYPESNALGDAPAYGLYARHIDGVSVKELKVKGRSSETREMLLLEDVTRAQAPGPCP